MAQTSSLASTHRTSGSNSETLSAFVMVPPGVDMIPPDGSGDSFAAANGVATGVPYAFPIPAGDACENAAVDEGKGVEMVAKGDATTVPIFNTDTAKAGFKSMHASSNCILVGLSERSGLLREFQIPISLFDIPPTRTIINFQLIRACLTMSRVRCQINVHIFSNV